MTNFQEEFQFSAGSTDVPARRKSKRRDRYAALKFVGVCVAGITAALVVMLTVMSRQANVTRLALLSPRGDFSVRLIESEVSAAMQLDSRDLLELAGNSRTGPINGVEDGVLRARLTYPTSRGFLMMAATIQASGGDTRQLRKDILFHHAYSKAQILETAADDGTGLVGMAAYQIAHVHMLETDSGDDVDERARTAYIELCREMAERGRESYQTMVEAGLANAFSAYSATRGQRGP